MREPPTLDPNAYAGWRATPLGAVTERVEMDLIFELAGPLAGKEVLDVGTGDGSYALRAAENGGIVTGLDVDPAVLAAAKARAAAMGLDVALVEGRVEALPFDDQSFDVVLAVTVLCFVQDSRLAFREMARLLRPGGCLVVGELGRFNVWAASRRIRGWFGSKTWRSAHFWTRRELRHQLCQAGLREVTIRGAIHYPPRAWAAGVFAPIDPWLSRINVPGAAFLAASAVRPVQRLSNGETE